MSNTTIRLKDYISDKTGESQVRVIIQYKSRQYPIPVPDVKIDPQYFSRTYGNWLTKSYTNKVGHNRVKTTVNNEIKKFNNEVYRVLLLCDKRARNDKKFKINSNTVKLLLNKSEEVIMGIQPIGFDNFYNKSFIGEYKKFIQTYTNKNTRKNLFQSVALIIAFQKNKKRNLKIKNFNHQMLTEFTEFLLDYGIRKDGKKIDDYIHSTLHKITFKNLNRFRNYLTKELKKNIPDLSDYNFESLVDVTELEPLNPQALTKTELDALFYYPFKNEGLINAKKLFFLGFAIGGQRVSDTLAVAKSQLYLDESGIIDFEQIKTRNYLENPLFSGYLSPLLKGEVIKATSAQALNKNLKAMIQKILDDSEFMIEAKNKHDVDLFKRKAKYVNYKGAKDCRFHYYKELQKDISFKYARSTFISTLIFDYNKTREEVAMFTGHKDLTIIDFYLKKYDNLKVKISQEIKPDSKYDISSEIEKKRLQEEYSDIENLDTEQDLLDASGIQPDDYS